MSCESCNRTNHVHALLKKHVTRDDVGFSTIHSSYQTTLYAVLRILERKIVEYDETFDRITIDECNELKEIIEKWVDNLIT